MQRWLMAIIAVAITLTGVGLYLWGPANFFGMSSAMVRAGLVLGALALALPQVKRFFQYTPPWFLALVAIGMILVVRWPKTIVVIFPLLVAAWFLGPRSMAKGKSKPQRAKQKPRPKQRAQRR